MKSFMGMAVVTITVMLLTLPPLAYAQPWSGRCIGVADGDTITVLRVGHEQVKIRLYGIDCPEKKQPFGTRAKQFASDMAFGRDVQVDPVTTDRYGRTVAWVTVDGRSVNKELVRAGMAWWYVKYAKGDAELERLEKEAREAKRGLWVDADAVPPWEWRKERKRK